MDFLVPDTNLAFVLISLGLVLLFLEVFIPSGGVLAVVAVGILALAIYGLFHNGEATLGVVAIVVSVGFSTLMFVVMLKRIRFTEVQDAATYTSADRSLPLLTGKSGTAESPLRPAGVARIDGQRIDVVALSGFIEKDRHVRVVETSGNRVVVRELSEDEEE